MSETEATAYSYKPFPGSSHYWALQEALALPPGPLKVLDVGAASGHVSNAIRESRPAHVSVTAVEPANPAPANWPQDDPWLDSVDAVSDSGFDLALALDVLEHVADPSSLLAQIQERCRPGATLLLSVPNVAHWSVRAQIAVGRFEYADRGILDRTHLRFFTRRSFRRLVEESGLSIGSLTESIAPLELLVPRTVSAALPWKLLGGGRRLAASVLPGLLGFQLLVRART